MGWGGGGHMYVQRKFLIDPFPTLPGSFMSRCSRRLKQRDVRIVGSRTCTQKGRSVHPRENCSAMHTTSADSCVHQLCLNQASIPNRF